MKISRTQWLAFLLYIGTSCFHSKAQVSLQADGRNHYNIQSYNGFKTTEDRGHKIQIALSGQNVNLSSWSLRARISSPLNPNVPNVSGLPFPVEKIKFRFTQEEINGSPPAPQPTLSSAGATLSPIPMSMPGTETPLISSAPVALQTGNSYYVAILYYFAIDVEGGAYLSGMLSDNGGNSWNTMPALYSGAITFSLYNSANIEVAAHTMACNIQVHRPLADAPETAPAYGIEVIGEARGGSLDIHNVSNYVNGTGRTYTDGLKIKSETPFEVTVKSLTSDMLSNEGYSLPVSVIKLQLLPGSLTSSLQAIYPPVFLSTAEQTVLTSVNEVSGTNLFSISYSTTGNDNRLLQAKTGSYSATLVYQLIPK